MSNLHDLIARTYAAGAPVDRIADAAGVSEGLVSRVAKQAGVSLRRPRRHDLTPRLARLAYEQAGTLRKAALLAHCSPELIRRRMLEASE